MSSSSVELQVRFELRRYESTLTNLCSMDKSRKLGWHGFVDSSEALLEVFDDFAKLKMIPAVPRAVVNLS